MDETGASPLYDRLQAVIAAWKAKDLEGALAHMAEDIVWHYAAPGLPPIKGKAMARKLLGRFIGDMHDVSWTIVHHAETADRLFVEGVDAYHTPEGVRVALPYAGVLDFEDGLIVGWRDYVDLEVLTQQKAGENLPPHVEALASRPAA